MQRLCGMTQGLVLRARAGLAAGTDSVQAGTAVNLFLRTGTHLQCRQDGDSSPGSRKESIQRDGRQGRRGPLFRGTQTVGSWGIWKVALSGH